ncbi:MAG TPA: nucleotidyltransferase family protein [Vicinamibacterales bacterium]
MTRDLGRALVDDETLRALSRNRATFHQVWEAAAEQGIAPYFGWRIEQTESFGWATATTRRAHEMRMQAAAVEAKQRVELERVCGALADGRVTALLMDGAALAYSHYPEPALRPRSTMVLLVSNGDRGEAERLLSAIGYEADLKGGKRLNGRCEYRRRDRSVPDLIDLRWRMGDAPPSAEALPFADAWRRRVPVPSVAHAMTFIVPDRLLVACLQHASADASRVPLLGLLDVHLLAVSLTLAQWQDFVDRASNPQIRAACVRTLREVVELFGTSLVADVHEWLEQRLPPGGATRAHAPAEYRQRAIGGVFGWMFGGR